MELLFLWIEDYLTFQNCGFNFSSQYIFSETVDKEKRSFILTIEENDDYVEDLFPENIANITAIVGENGTGKSNLLDFLIRLQTDSLYLGEKFLVVYKDLSNDNLKIYHTLFDIDFETERKSNDWDVKSYQPESIIIELMGQINVPYGMDILGTQWKGIEDEESTVIFYTPIFDLRNYEKLQNQNKKYVDVSTNYFIFADSADEKNEPYDQVDHHRFKNVYRQLNFVLKDSENFTLFSIPDVIEVRFNKNNDTRKDDLGTFTKGLYEWIRKFGSKALHNDNSEINKAREDNDRAAVQKAQLGKVKTWFLINLIDNFFYNLSLIKDLVDEEFLVRQEDIEDEDFSQAVINFFKSQNLIPNAEFNFSDFISSIFKIIDVKVDKGLEIAENDAFFSLPLSLENEVLEVVNEVRQLHTKYLSVIKEYTNSEYGIGFLDFNWRDLSSGEKAYLDLFARLFDAYRTLTEDTESLDNLRIIYFLIDEGEGGFHPQWQKKYIDWLTTFLTDLTDLKVQLIITSHSPFVLSDLPAANNILLKKVDHGKTSVVSYQGKNSTFGANIHELYADSFFLQDGTTGEFARKKIYWAINLLKKDSLSTTDKNNLKRLINIVGEPLIKDRLMDMYNEKIGSESPEEKVTRLEKELQDAKNELNNDKS